MSRTVGRVARDAAQRRWTITCEPHVALRLKRVFSKLGTHAREAYHLSDTIENARDLAWFLERYPMQVDDEVYLRTRAGEHVEQIRLVEDMLAKRATLPPFDLAVPAREYQKQAAALVLTSGGLLLADDLGIGKTVSGICTFCDPRTLPAIVVTLTHLPEQWRREIVRFAPKLKVCVLQTGKPYPLSLCTRRHAFVADGPPEQHRCARCGTTRDEVYHGRSREPDVIVTSYSKLAGWAETLAPVARSVVFDEAQELRKSESAKYSAAALLGRSAAFRLAMTATPVYNYGGEIFNVIDVVRPDALGTYEEFKTEWCRGGQGDQASIADPKAFGVYARDAGLMLRRTRADVGRELPALQNIPHYIQADMAALDKVSDSCAELARFILGLGTSPLRLSPEAKAKGEKMLASEELSNKLRQATGIAKAPFVAEFVRMIVESGERVLLYGWHREVYRIWLDRLANLEPAMYTGTESASEKQDAMRRFVDGKARVLIMSLRAGAGLDGLQTVCRTVAYGELDWSPGVHEQGTGRVHRDGQRDPVVAYYLMADVGSDPIVADVLGVKGQQIHGLRDPNAELVEKLNTDPERVKRLAQSYLEQRGVAA